MAFISFVPKAVILKKFIAYYYCDGSPDPLYHNSYLFYPHVNTTVSFYQNADCRLNETSAIISYNTNAEHLKLVTQQSLPRRVTQLGRTNKTAVVFKPLGLNRFVNEKYSQIVPSEAQIFTPSNNVEWNLMLDDFLRKAVISVRQIPFGL